MNIFSLKKLVILPDNPNDCWMWNGTKNKKTGYGKKTYHGSSHMAHRWIYQMLFGKIADNMVINHLCNNRLCVNPYHLEVVTQQINCQKGNGTKLNEKQVKQIKSEIKNMQWGERSKIAKKYGISPALISDIKYGRAWTNI